MSGIITANESDAVAMPASGKQRPPGLSGATGADIGSGRSLEAQSPGCDSHGAPISAAQFVATIRAHEDYVLRCRGGQRADLRLTKFPGVNLRKRRLDSINFSGANLQGANFAGASLDLASLSCADLTRANLAEASLKRADLRGARVQGASFEFADMDGADFRQATIVVTGNDKWTIVGQDKDKSTIVSFANCSLKGAKLQNANLKDANFDGALLNGASFAGTTLGNASFEGAVLIGVKIAELRLPPSRLKNCITDPGPEQQSRLPQLMHILETAQLWAESGGRQGAAANLEGEDIRLLAPVMKNRKLTGIKCTKTLAVNADFTGCELQAANFDGADLRGALFIGADLRGASFQGANLAHAIFRQANLLPLQLKSGVTLSTKFDGATLDGANFEEVLR